MNGSLLSPPSPGLLQAGCYWRPEPTAPPRASAPTSDQTEGILAEVSLTEEESEDRSSSAQPSLVPSPKSTDHDEDAPISVSSTEDEVACSPTEDTERSDNAADVVALTSVSEDEPEHGDGEDETEEDRGAAEEEEAEETDEEEDAEEEEEAECGQTSPLSSIWKALRHFAYYHGRHCHSNCTACEHAS